MHLVYLLSFLTSINAIDKQLGWIFPAGEIRTEVGNTIQVVCTFNKNHNFTKGKNSSSLYFTINDGQVKINSTVTLDETSIELIHKNVSTTTKKIYCFFDKRAIDFVKVFVGHKPRDVKWFNCTSKNLENLNCSFERQPNLLKPSYNLSFSYRSSNRDFEQSINESFIDDHRYSFMLDANKYRPSKNEIIFKLSSKNSLGKHTQYITINIKNSVIPDPPTITGIDKKTPHIVQVHYKFSRNIKELYTGIIARFQLYSNMTESKDVDENEIKERRLENQSFTFVGLIPNSCYTVSIALRLACASNPDQMWSEFGHESFFTQSAIPDHSPKTDMAAFNIVASESLSYVYIYWIEVAKKFHYGSNYSVEVCLYKQCKAFENKWMAKFETIPNANRDDLLVQISSRNSVGISNRSSTLVIPSQSKLLPYPQNLHKYYENNTYRLSWEQPKGYQVKNYTVFWCNAKTEKSNDCNKPINFTQVTDNNFTYYYPSAELNFAVAANSEDSTSGMTWAKCTLGPDSEIGTPIDITLTAKDFSTFSLKWNLNCADQSMVVGYNIKYCRVSNQTSFVCNGDEKYQRFTNNSLSYDLQNLLPNTTYKIQMNMYSSSNTTGPLSEAQLFTTNVKPPHEWHKSIITIITFSTICTLGLLLYYHIKKREIVEIAMPAGLEDIFEKKNECTIAKNENSFTPCSEPDNISLKQDHDIQRFNFEPVEPDYIQRSESPITSEPTLALLQPNEGIDLNGYVTQNQLQCFAHFKDDARTKVNKTMYIENQL